jgi:gamma-glutamyl-gamma-aminobutyrate hydrolase PuuD
LIIQNGGIAINILPTDKTMVFNDNDINDPKELTEEEKNDLYQVVDKCDGIVLQGGLVSCKYEIEVAKRALELNIPVMGICAGFNNILRAIGTDVIEDKTGSHNYYDMNYRHNITIEKDTMLYEILKKEKMLVNSIHSMIAKKEEIEKFVKVSSYSDDGLVESFELPEKKFVLGIKWHPELMMTDVSTQRLFKRFVDECILK